MQSPGELFSVVAAIPPKNVFIEVYMSLPVGKAVYLTAFSSLLSYIRKLTDQPATHIAYCLLMLITYAYICSLQIFIYIFAPSLKSMYN